MKQQEKKGHLAAFVTIFIWGTTFISTKVLLRALSPIEILFIRFLMGYLALFLLYPKFFHLKIRQENWLFLGAGVSGITLYYLLENIALTMTSASNVGIILTTAPFFTALLSTFFLKTEKPGWLFYVGFCFALLGITLISINGSSVQLNPFGDILALLAAVIWAVYSILTRKIGTLGYAIIPTTRRIFSYGILLMIPFLFLMDFQVSAASLLQPVVLGNLLYLGFGASALCFVTWNTAVKILGAVKTSVYIYLTPVVTVATSVLILGEKLTPSLLAGAALTLLGLWLSEAKFVKSAMKKKQIG